MSSQMPIHPGENQAAAIRAAMVVVESELGEVLASALRDQIATAVSNIVARNPIGEPVIVLYDKNGRSVKITQYKEVSYLNVE